MEIFIPSKTPSPIYVPKPHPTTFKDQYAHDKYNALQVQRWVEGYRISDSLFIPPTLYFMMNELTFKNRLDASDIKPECRDVDLIIHTQIHQSRLQTKWDFIMKSRGVGLSALLGGCLPMYFARQYPGATINLTSADQGRLDRLFSENLIVCYESMREDIKPDKINYKGAEGDVALKIGVKNSRGETKVTTIWCRPSSNSDGAASNFSGGGAIYSGLDEIALHKRRKRLANSLLDAMREKRTGKLKGYTLAGGTVEEKLNSDELAEYKKMWDEAGDSQIWNRLFIPFWMGMETVNGHSNQKKAEIWWNQQAEAYLKSGDSEGFIAFKKNNPRTEQDVFDLASISKWNEGVKNAIKIQAGKVAADKSIIWVRSTIGTVNNDTIATPDFEKGKHHIFLPPQAGVKYRIGIDGVATGKETGEVKGSWISSIVNCMWNPNGKNFAPQALYWERPDSLESAFANILAQIKYYNKFGGVEFVCPEASNSTVDLFSTIMKKEGLLKLLMKRKDLSGKGNINENRFGQPKTPPMINYAYGMANIILEKYIGNIECPMLLKQMMQDFSDNLDVLDSWLQFIVSLDPNFDTEVVKKDFKRAKWAFQELPDGTNQFIFYGDNDEDSGIKLVEM